ncbi:heavy metal response regulator transcription factor [Geomonas sp. Red69]|uniref:Heavy metal response regulator transcription factor n=1 Tax=Geomonas diazotrophica TaxID=2843197 RepID=A0ABX8JF54_9BACT|nr:MULTISPECIES: heavy metal response regulator transcription factor [Geomonas]MBU5635856.1 heavy metal response regulator transcription factor [Geomonas diazotrophica]QWV96948.1 heavy metal response regulator transcription factor [Geomonas nitrogeniifigens]QXE86124.1 heavy metal response regulator transcription factor [Geomonas nitrogeniifigens]
MRILIIEDEQKAANYLKKGLTENGFSADIANDGEDGLHLAMTEQYDLVILDVMLPVKGGWAIIQELRAAGKDVPVIFLSARDAVHDRVHGLELGADDYLVKPYAFSELLARIRIILRRHPLQQTELLRLADLELDLVRHKARRGGQSLDLTVKEFQLLALMLRRRGEVLSRTTISEQVWGINFDSDTNVVDVAIRRLRKKVDDPFPLKLIQTIRGVGYVIDEVA